MPFGVIFVLATSLVMVVCDLFVLPVFMCVVVIRGILDKHIK